MPESPVRATPVAGIHYDDIVRLDQALVGLSYPARKWQLIAHATEIGPRGRDRTDPRTMCQLWALPTGHYLNLTQVLVGAARTARGHPHRALGHPPTRPPTATSSPPCKPPASVSTR
jgi:hypothetical protein